MAKLAYFSQVCPLVEEFNIKNVVGCLNKKQWMFGYQFTTTAPTDSLTFLTMTGGMIENLGEYEVLVQKIGNPNVIDPHVGKTSSGITLVADVGELYHLIFFGFGPTRPTRRFNNTPKWAMDYCPYCKAMKYKGIIGSIVKDIVAFAFKATTDGAGFVSVDFGSVTQSTGKYAGLGGDNIYDSGQQKHYLVRQMADTEYYIAVTKSTPLGGLVTVTPWVSNITKIGFEINGDPSQEYDVLVLGQIQY